MRILFLLLATAVPAGAANLPSPNWPGPADRGDQLLRASVLASHNAARRNFGVEPVAWNAQLAAGAMVHARQMARTGIYEHDRTPGRRAMSGENLWRGQRGIFSYDRMVQVMVDEARLFRPGAFPHNSANGRWQSVAHFTQIVWPSTTHVGCALSSSASTDYLVCRYAPAGNREGVYLAAGAAGKTVRSHLADGGN